MILKSNLHYHYTNLIGNQVCERISAQLSITELDCQNLHKRLVIKFDDILSISTFDDSKNLNAKNLDFVIEALPRLSNQKFGIGTHRQLRSYRFSCPSSDIKAEWIAALKKVFKPAEFRQMITLINPKSGHGKAKHHLRTVAQIFQKSNVHLDIAELQGSAILYEGIKQSFSRFFQSLDLTKIDGIIVCGGDGTVHSMVNALMKRADWPQAIKTPIGILPSGTDNGLCKTALALSGEPYCLTSAAFLIVKGRVRSLDVFKIHQEKRTFYGVHSLAWGLISDIDIESNSLRFLGPFKEWIYGLAYVLRRRSYTGNLSFEPQLPLKATSPCLKNKLSERFIGIWAVNVPWAGRDRLSTPFAKLDDGLIDLLVLRQGISRKSLLELFIKSEDGSHIHCPELEYYKTQTLVLNPISTPGIITVDGEAVDYEPIRIQVLQKRCTIFCS